MAEIQEEILWICEAAHVPVIWATQVLEKLAKTGIPSRAEITDAAMSERAECVMLNKGPFIRGRREHPRQHPAANAGASDKETRDAAATSRGASDPRRNSRPFDRMQGYFISQPLIAAELSAYLRDSSIRMVSA